MNKQIIEELKQKLEKGKESLEKELSGFAKEDPERKGDWGTRYPKFEGGSMESEADEVQEYEKLLSVEYNLETRLRDINIALEKIKKDKYGKCEKCEKNIDIKRLEACPEAKLCTECK